MYLKQEESCCSLSKQFLINSLDLERRKWAAVSMEEFQIQIEKLSPLRSFHCESKFPTVIF